MAAEPNSATGTGSTSESLCIGHDTISYVEAGSGPAVVLLHGIGSAGESFQTIVERLASQNRAIAWDAPGYGQSSPLPGAQPGADDYAHRLGEFLDHIEVHSCVLAGHSLGAIIGAAFARRFPNRVRALVLADPAQGYARAGVDERREKLAARLHAFDRLGADGVASSRGPALLSPKATPAMIGQVVTIMARLNAEGYRHAAGLLAYGDLLADLEHWQGPTLVLCGSEDSITPPAGARKVADAVNGARYETIADAGHASYIEQPDQFLDFLRTYIDGLPAGNDKQRKIE